MQQYQGDIRIEDTGAIPAEARPLEPRDGLYILAEGEATGHSHSIAAAEGVEVWECGPCMYVKVGRDGVAIEHPEHRSIMLAPGSVVEIGRQTEYRDALPFRVDD